MIKYLFMVILFVLYGCGNTNSTSTGCNDKCSQEGVLSCDGKNILECQKDSRGCFDYKVNSSCAEEESCMNGSCFKIECDSYMECFENQKECVSEKNFKVCGNFDSDICLEWSDITSCSENSVCKNGECVCENGVEESRACDIFNTNQNGTQIRVCQDGKFGDFGVCNDPDVCENSLTQEIKICGNGIQPEICTDGQWRDSGDCKCNNGYWGENCDLDKDECALGTDNCHENATCTNTIGSFICDCSKGYSGDGVTSCIDIDECTLGTDNCIATKYCVNSIGSFSCNYCGCETDNTVSNLDSCSDEIGQCSCKVGYGGLKCDQCAEHFILMNSVCVPAIVLNEIEPNVDWIELYNRGSDAISIVGWRVDSDIDTHTFGANSTVPANGYLVLPSGEFNSNSSNTVTLTDDNSVLIDSTNLSSVELNHSWGRYPNGVGDFRALGVVTYNAMNKISDTINWCATITPENINGVLGRDTAFILGDIKITNKTGTGRDSGMINAQVCYTSDLTGLTGLTCVDATYFSANTDRDRYRAKLNISTVGTYKYFYRFSINNGESWVACNLESQWSSALDPSKVGNMTVGIAFVTSWRLTTIDIKSITIPTNSANTYNYSIDCTNDGVFEATNVTGNYTCNYSNSGVYEIAIVGNFPQIQFNNGGDRLKITSVIQWGRGVWSSMNSAFYGCSNLNGAMVDAPDLSNVTDMFAMFTDATIFNQPLNSWNVSAVTNMRSMFYDARAFNQSLNNWNVSNVIDMNGIFAYATAFNQNLSGWDVDQVDDYTYFDYAATSWSDNNKPNFP